MTSKATKHSNLVGKNRGDEFVDDDGTSIYVSYHPRFILRHYVWLVPQKIIYREWEEEMTITGDDLSSTFDSLKSSKPATVKKGLQPDGSTIFSIKSKWKP